MHREEMRRRYKREMVMLASVVAIVVLYAVSPLLVKVFV
jgi:hypothetical protein